MLVAGDLRVPFFAGCGVDDASSIMPVSNRLTRENMRKLSIALFVALAFTLAFAQKDKSKRPSQPGTASVTLGGHQVVIDYSRPKIADPKTGQPRTIFGGLVPYGEVWRT